MVIRDIAKASAGCFVETTTATAEVYYYSAKNEDSDAADCYSCNFGRTD
jgi:hypothetical protein